AVASEEPELRAKSFDVFLAAGLDLLADDAIAHWLKFGRPLLDDAGKTLLLEPPAPKTWDAIASELLKRPRLSAASAYADQMVTALSVPPRRHAPQQLPLGGYADVVTRGHVERLLPSQHAFDDLEFLRRYAEGELLYFRREEPPSRNRMEMAIALDQGVRTWGDVRLVLAAAVLALIGRADRKGLRLTIAATSRPGFVEPLGMAAEDLGQLLEASDLSRDPGMALERVLDDPAAAPRDIYLLTHPFALAEDDVRSAALRLAPGDRLFALTLNAKGAAELCEIRHGLPVRLRAFRVDFVAATAPPAAKPPRPRSIEPARWTGHIENDAWPFAFPINGPVAHFDFDHEGTKLFVVYANGMIAMWDLETKRMEILPRPTHQGRILVKWEQILGVRDGFTLLGASGSQLVVVHYDNIARQCLTLPIPGTVPQCRLAPMRGNHAIAVLCDYPPLGFVNVKTVLSFRMGTWKAAPLQSLDFRGDRTLHGARQGPGINTLGTYDIERITGEVMLVPWDPDAEPWKPFAPQTNGKPTFAEPRVVDDVQLAETTVAIASHDSSHQRKVMTIDFFRGPEGDFLRQVVRVDESDGWRRRFRLSHDGRLVAVATRDQVEVLTIDTARRQLQTPTGNGGIAARLWIGPGSFMISCGNRGHSWVMVEWGLHLTVHTESRKASTLSPGFRSVAIQRFVAKVSKMAPIESGVNLSFKELGAMAVTLDAYGQVTLTDHRGDTVFRFHARGASWSAWMPDGTRLDRGNAHQERSTEGASAKMAAALRRAMKGV
ncbi:MAG TPA: hypothetical protein VHR72_02235, partial [Gemmataceae bacterium]|nr:hypothetical protein [Gemmataceae bacterium]